MRAAPADPARMDPQADRPKGNPMTEQPDRRTRSRASFRRWPEEQAGGARQERVDGEPVAKAPERIIHARLKARVWQALDRPLSCRGRSTL